MPPSLLSNQIKVEAANAPDPVRALLDCLGSASSREALMQLPESQSFPGSAVWDLPG